MTDTQTSKDSKDEESSSIVVTQTDAKEKEADKKELEHPDGCCGSCS